MFVRTKTGIYDFEEQRGNIENRGEKSFLAIGNDYRGCTCYDYEEIIQEADTIEELCDGYYLYNGYDDKFNPDRIYTTDEKAKALEDCKDLAFYIDLMCRGRYICELRAFIETDKGLIFIGKFNENGELVLI